LTKECKDVDEARAPRYHVTKRIETDLKPGYGVRLFVVVSKKDFTSERMLQLGCKLRADFSQFQLVNAFVFESSREAKRYDDIGDIDSADYRKFPTRPRATYLYYEKTCEHHIEWYPVGTPYSLKDAAKEKAERISLRGDSSMP
jgi:hypothetical protein